MQQLSLGPFIYLMPIKSLHSSYLQHQEFFTEEDH